MLYPTLARRGTVSLWDDIFNMRRDFDRLIDRFGTNDMATAAWAPAVDVRETGDTILVDVELAGLRPEDVDVRVENGVLTVSGEKKSEIQEGTEGSSYHLVERRYGRFERSFTLPRTVDADRVEANFSHGVLTISLPKAEGAKPRRVQIKSGNGTSVSQR